MIRISQLKSEEEASPEALKKRAAALLCVPEEEIKEFSVRRHSLDAREKPRIFHVYTVVCSVNHEKKVLSRNRRKNISAFREVRYRPKKGVSVAGRRQRPVVVGFGPAGMFASLLLARAGLCPLVFERGSGVEERLKKVEAFWNTGLLDGECNVQFGEGGAGTFSDGKLNTMVNDPKGRNRFVLESFVHFGAEEEILTEGQPHIGSDRLRSLVRALREEVEALGGEVRFDTRITDFLSRNGALTGVRDAAGNTYPCSSCILAPGHSARDTFGVLSSLGLPMEAKPFAVGLRIEHLQRKINLSRYGVEDSGIYGAASYKVTHRALSGRGIYSFCMCPGGFVVNASSEKGHLAVNGMSLSGRDGENANSAIVITVTPSDFPDASPLGGMAFQRALEKKAFELGGGRIPVQRFGDFAAGNPSGAFGSVRPAAKGAVALTDLTALFPGEMRSDFLEGMAAFDRQIPGFADPDCLLSGVESRTSSPVRILRGTSLEAGIRGLYPCGEGAGYAGGIMSAAMDGMKCAEEVIRFVERESQD